MSGIDEFTPAFFDEASAAWRLNKIVKPEGTFRYKRNAFPAEKPVRKPIIKHVLRRSLRLAKKKKLARK